MNEELILQRRKDIFNFIRWRGRTTIEEIGESLRMSPSTVRRDIKKLADEHKIIQFHGGVALKSGDDPFSERETRKSEEKHLIGLRAATLVKSGDIIYVGGGSSAYAFAKALAKEADDITVVCAAVNIAMCFADNFRFKTILLGGVFNRFDESMFSPLTISNLEIFNFNCAFLGVSALNASRGYCLPTLELAELKKAVIKRADKTVLLADSTKIGKTGGFTICPADEVSCVVTDEIKDEKKAQELIDLGIDFIYA